MSTLMDDPTTSSDARAVAIVAIGASAGGLEALRQLFAQVPLDTGMAFVVIQHLDPTRPSMLTDVLAGDIDMPVAEVTDGMVVEPDHVYVIPPGADLGLRQGVLVLRERAPGRKIHLPIDGFFRELAEEQPDRAIGVVLSGSAFDGTEGLRAIRAAGGITCAQDPESAQFRSMPESAIAAGVVDFRGAPGEIGAQLGRLGDRPFLVMSAGDEADEGAPAKPEHLAAIAAAVLRHTQIDLKGYKRSTIDRRIARRMVLRSVGSLDEYVELLRDDPSEAQALAEDVFIHVTSFFRDPDAFVVLEQQVLPRIVERKGDGETIRIWVPGCSSGQEVYSLAMGTLELFDREERSISVKIFGSDVSERSIAVARAGVYSERELEGVGPERRSRFFDRVDGHFRVCREVREVCVFAKHDLTRDPPFARLDLISCRNVLIYFDNELQRRILPMLHHSLDAHGYLFLGRSESVGAVGDLFDAVDSRHRIFRKVGDSRPRAHHPRVLGREAEAQQPLRSIPGPEPSREAQRQADHLLLARFAPPGAVVDEQLEVIQFRGRTGAFLEPPPGQPQRSILRMAREGLVGHLHEAIEAAKAQSVTIRREGVRITADGASRVIDLEVVPLPGIAGSARHFLVLFLDAAPDEASADDGATRAAAVPSKGARTPPPAPTPTIEEQRRLEAELAATRDYLQVALAEHQDATQELAAANEEMVAANEELQATNEELESAKEELQSTNEELTTVNDELRNRNQELDLVAADLAGVLESVEIPVLIVDHELRIRRFTPIAHEVFWILPTDVGRSIEEVKLKVDVDDLGERITSTIHGGRSREWEIQARDGRWLRLRIRPYRTAGHRLDGAILSFVDVDVLKRAVQAAERARDYARAVVETVPVPLLVLDASMRIASANHAFCRAFELAPILVEGVGLLQLDGGTWNVPALREAVERVVTTRSLVRDVALEIVLPRAGHRMLSLSGSHVSGEGGGLVVLAIEDVTARRMLEASEREARIGAEQANRAKDLFLATLSHELRTPLATILMSAQILGGVAMEGVAARHATAALGRAVGNLTKLIDDLLDISRIVSGKLMLDLQSVDLTTIVEHAIEDARPAIERKGLALALDMGEAIGPVHGDPVRLQQVVANLLGNAIKFTPKGGTITVGLRAAADRAELVVSDDGIGIRPEALPHLFDRFVQAEGSMTRAHGGLGLGLAIVRHLVDVHGGEVWAESAGVGKGSTFRVVLPLSMPETQATGPEAPSVTARSIRGVDVLLIEDDDDARTAFSMMLEELGAEVRAVRSTAEGLAAVEQRSPQVILCDIAMPVEDGYAFIRKLRSRGPERDGAIPAAALTALASQQDRERALRSGFDMHLTKPIDAAALAAAVGALADAGTAEPAAPS